LFEFTLPDFYPFISLIFWKLISSRLFYISIDYLFCYGGFSLNVQLHPIILRIFPSLLAQTMISDLIFKNILFMIPGRCSSAWNLFPQERQRLGYANSVHDKSAYE